MTMFLTVVAIIVVVLSATGLHRVWKGPTIFDRLVAIALITVNGVAILVLLGFIFDLAEFFLDIALVYALLAFILPIALGRYFENHGDEEDNA